ncbi:MAG: beta-ketoacyl-[acyl-carrier-protein] synthase family protein [Bacteroidales bacterium]|nr:beta-ketoacyl-[acyl-carrier-protein] synthase family protein [Bacteroidales bacterium]
MSEKVYVTGLGIISSLGLNLTETYQSLLAERSGLERIKYLNTIHKDYFVAEVKASNKELSQMLGIDYKLDLPRTTLLAVKAAAEAFADAGLNANLAATTGIISGTTVGGMDKTERQYKIEGAGFDYIKSHSCGYSTEVVADYIGLNGYISTISTACSSAANAVLIGSRLIKHGLADRILVGGTDALARFTLNGFKSLLILDPNECKPFDKNRKGLNLGEGAAYIVIESEKSARKRGAKILAEVAGYANANDAHHQTASSPDGVGPYLCMEKALKVAGLPADAIDYVNVHGTGTENNDITEAIAMQSIFGSKMPLFSSTKSYTGHTLGASGAIEAIFSILSIQNEILFPNLRFTEKMEGFDKEPIKKVTPNTKVNHIMSNSFGFGGNDSSLIFSKV